MNVMIQIVSEKFITDINDVLGLKRGEGAEAKYFQTGPNIGVKIFTHPINARVPATKSVKQLTRSSVWKEMQRQYRLIEKLSLDNHAPKIYALHIVSDEFGWLYPAMQVEHVDFHISTHDLFELEIQIFVNSFKDQIKVGDPHSGNIVFCKRDRKFKIIDFGAVEEKALQS